MPKTYADVKLRPEIKTAIPGPKSQAIIARDAKHASPSYIKEYPLVVERGEGSWIYDADGNRYLDLMAGIATASTGHAHPKVVKAIQDAAAKFLHICATDFYYESLVQVFEKFANYVPQMGPKKIFLGNSGSEVVDGAMKLARHHTKRHRFIAFKGGFHGRTYGAISINASKNYYKAGFGPTVPGVTLAPYNCDVEEVFDKSIFYDDLDPKDVAAIILEPVLGEGGYVVPEKKFLQDLRALCDKHGILLIFDEVQCGVGRTGHMFASEYFGVAPDIYLSAKGIASGMPLAAIVAKESVCTWPRASHGSTYGGNPVSCAASVATLDIVEQLLPDVRSNGDYFMQGLRKLQSRHASISDVRGLGYMIGVEFRDPKTREPAKQYMVDIEQTGFRKGLLLLGCGKSTIRLAPPLVLNRHEIDVALGILDETLSELDRKYGY